MADDNGEKFSPVRFILGDWLSIHSVIDKVEPKLANILAAKMLDVVLNGRAGNCSLIADLQSFNVLAIGLKGDSNVRANLNLICLGNYSIDSYGTINDSYGVLDNILNSHHVIPEKEIRQRLKEEYKKLKPISMKNSRPILFSSLSPVTLSMVPDLMGYGGV